MLYVKVLFIYFNLKYVESIQVFTRLINPFSFVALFIANK